MVAEARISEEKSQKAMVDAARIADELRQEQEIAQNFERNRKLLECQVKDTQQRLDEAETNALKGGKKAMNKMETRIRELESELNAESRRFNDAQKNLRKSERHIQELVFAADEDRKNHERMQALTDQLQVKIKSYKKQIEEAEEIAALNLAKFRQAQANLAESVVIIDPIPDRDVNSKEDEQVLQLLKKQLAPRKDGVYSPEVRRLAESLAEMFPNTSLSYLLHRCTFNMFYKCKRQEFCILYSS